MSDVSEVTFATDDEFVDTSAAAAIKLSNVLSREEIEPFIIRSDARAWWIFIRSVGAEGSGQHGGS